MALRNCRQVDKKGAAADIISPFFPLSLSPSLCFEKFWRQISGFNSLKPNYSNDGPGLGFKKSLQARARVAFFKWQKLCYDSNRVGRITNLFPEIYIINLFKAKKEKRKNSSH